MFYYFIVNKSSKSGLAAVTWDRLEAMLLDRTISYEAHFTEGPGHARELAAEASVRADVDCICVMGGDGTLNEVLNGIVDFSKVKIGYIPSGSANDFAKGIGLSGTSEEILDRILDSNRATKSFDLGEVSYEDGKHVFAVSSGIGVDAYVCLQALDSKLKKFLNLFHMGQATYGLLTVGDLFTMKLAACDITVGSEIRHINGAIFVAAMNCPYEGGGIPMVPYARANSGHLSAFMAHDIARIKCFFLLPKLIAGKHIGKKGFDFIDFDTMTIKMDKPMCVHADGEYCGFHDQVVFKCLPQALQLRGLDNE